MLVGLLVGSTVLWCEARPEMAVAQVIGSTIPEDRCILELDLPNRATVGLTIRFGDGRQEERTILVQGGRIINFASIAPGSWKPELALQFGHDGDVTSVAFSPDGRQVLTGSQDNTARLWDAATARGRKGPRFAGSVRRLPGQSTLSSHKSDGGRMRDAIFL